MLVPYEALFACNAAGLRLKYTQYTAEMRIVAITYVKSERLSGAANFEKTSTSP